MVCLSQIRRKMKTINITKENSELIGSVDYYIIPTHRILYIKEIAIYGVHKNKGHGTKAIFELFIVNKVFIDKIVGITTNPAKGFWKKLGAEISSEEEKSGDCFFSLRFVDLIKNFKGVGLNHQ